MVIMLGEESKREESFHYYIRMWLATQSMYVHISSVCVCVCVCVCV